MVKRIYVEKKPGFDVEAKQLLAELRTVAGEGLSPDTTLRIVNVYDVEGIDDALFEQCIPTVFSEPQVDDATSDLPVEGAHINDGGDVETPADVQVFAVEALPGQFDQRADSAAQCIQFISQGERPTVRAMKVYVLEGAVSPEALAAVKHYVINPIECREASLTLPDTLEMEHPTPQPVEVVDGFLELDEDALRSFIAARGLAMDLADIVFLQAYFRDEEKRCPTITEIKMVDTYWSDHCRHTTFGTELTDVAIDDPQVQAAYDRYLEMRHELGRDEKPICLMDMGTIGAKYLKAKGILTGLDESEEINACTVKAKVDVDGEDQDWLYLFKNETHNHPTEIEPFGGAATCLGGAIRDPLSGRSYVYQAMRVTGAGDPTVPISDTIEGKLPQRKLVQTAAAGYSSYGNQIGLATGQVNELYHPGYVAKRMEIGAVVAATPADHVVREKPTPGDVIVLLGGRTGRDGIGGATGSSKAHDLGSLESCGAEVQKGNAPVERKLQRLFRRGEACRLIKRCNDFGAGGVSVALGEIADGLHIDLNKVPKKYEGLDGTELAISESQERMACAIAAKDADEFIGYAVEENLEATVIATVTDDERVRILWNDEPVVDVSRAFLASNGGTRSQAVHVEAGGSYMPNWPGETPTERMKSLVSDLNVASNKGLAERFDSTIGAGSVLMPFGGKYQLTPAQAMVCKLPVDGETTTCSGMAWGFNPYLTEANQFTGSYLAVVESVSRLVASGFKHEDMYLTFQEYFERLRGQANRWGKPMAAVLGALQAQVDLGIGSIGGKDSMSGSFEDLDVPPTLVSFATALGKVENVISPEFKGAGHRVVCIDPAVYGKDLLPDPAGLLEVFSVVEQLVDAGSALAISTPGYGCAAEAMFKMCLGNRIGLACNDQVPVHVQFIPTYGSFIIELADDAEIPAHTDAIHVHEAGTTLETYEMVLGGESISLNELQEIWERPLEGVYPYRNEAESDVEPISSDDFIPLTYNGNLARPRVIIPVFPGTNCEYDTVRAFERAGAEAHTLIINNLTPAKIAESTEALVRELDASNILMIPGGFSGGDEPEGSAKFITSFFRSPQVADAVMRLLNDRDGLALGICNGFQALVKLGLVPFGEIRPMDDACPTLTFNQIGRHQSRIVRTRVTSSLSPWLSRCKVGDIHTVPISNGEGRFVVGDELFKQLVEHGQIAAQYVDASGAPSMDWAHNPSSSMHAIEAVTSPDGRVLGKMGHSERVGRGTYKNIPDYSFQPLIEGGVGYFTE